MIPTNSKSVAHRAKMTPRNSAAPDLRLNVCPGWIGTQKYDFLTVKRSDVSY